MKKSKLVLIGASTGGPGHLNRLLKGINNSNTPIVIAQHMNSVFVPYFVSQFGREMNMQAIEVSKKELLSPKVFVCSKTSVLSEDTPLSLIPKDVESIYNPNINVLFQSAVNICGFIDVLAILLTGIGDDGAKGLFDLYRAGATCIAESEESAIVYGMPKKAKEINPDVNVMHLDDIRIKLESFLYVF
ncbi:CheB methylesterase domain-containing protein [Helicobacter cappadocius]|uniref:protein-glutamate methylesterase n=1 Tax=Helicobacter cappadocius TaxID=3063998 RepID=A0AA90PRV8_9HELI|nr:MULTISPECIES: CheB methylesterase domain-containing protein [unclassified Helicobacter]MDO7252467.1 CheB methylesterase domain-containing protein [Helicobacter sp. faydin-H75]MDP2538334.1 CheB methylesterase domain-containing protein [Helicobacter sp. faydin-H76]